MGHSTPPNHMDHQSARTSEAPPERAFTVGLAELYTTGPATITYAELMTDLDNSSIHDQVLTSAMIKAFTSKPLLPNELYKEECHKLFNAFGGKLGTTDLQTRQSQTKALKAFVDYLIVTKDIVAVYDREKAGLIIERTEKNYGEDQCPVCFEDWNEVKMMTTRYCDHAICEACIGKIQKRSKKPV